MGQPMFIDVGGGEQLFAIYHEPAGEVRRRNAVLLCHPAQEEYMRCHRAIRQLAERLAAQGFAVMRFDYFGTGDSTGATGRGSLERWALDTRQLSEVLLDKSGAPWLSLVGIRLGAAVALKALNTTLPVDDLILWDPVLQGKDYLADLLRMQGGLRQELKILRPLWAKIGLGKHETIGFPQSIAMHEQLLSYSAGDIETKSAVHRYLLTDQSGYPALKDFLARQQQQGCNFFHHQLDQHCGWGEYRRSRQTLFAHKAIAWITDILQRGEPHE